MSKYAGFNSVELRRPDRSQFDLSHTKRLTTRAGRLTPVFLTECLPGDTFNGNSEILVRLAPLLAPIYDSLTLFVHFFFVPNRLLWSEWETFITGGRLGVGIDPAEAPVPPFLDIGDGLNADGTLFDESGLPDYLGVPCFRQIPGYVDPDSMVGSYLDVMPFAAYQKVWYDYYRDRNFVPDDVINLPLPSGQYDVAIDQSMMFRRTRCWEHDYFTSALPNTQRGQEVLIPLAGVGSVTYLDQSRVREPGNPGVVDNGNLYTDGITNGLRGGGGATDFAARIENIDEVLIENSATSINDFRSAYALQVWLERNEIGGSRYNESTLAHFGVRPQDSRLQRAEYLGGGRIPIKISEVVSTAYSDDGDSIVPLANLGGHGITYGNTNQFRYFCPEHGFIIGIASIMSPPSYFQGLPRMFRRKSFLDYPWPTFAKLGEQAVSKAELFASRANMTEDSEGEFPLFGYQSRYAEWKYLPNTSHGQFRSTLLFWTLTRNFTGNPTLSEQFTTYTDSVQNRIFAVGGTSDNFWLYVNNSVRVVRCLPYFGTPNTLGFA